MRPTTNCFSLCTTNDYIKDVLIRFMNIYNPDRHCRAASDSYFLRAQRVALRRLFCLNNCLKVKYIQLNNNKKGREKQQIVHSKNCNLRFLPFLLDNWNWLSIIQIVANNFLPTKYWIHPFWRALEKTTEQQAFKFKELPNSHGPFFSFAILSFYFLALIYFFFPHTNM